MSGKFSVSAETTLIAQRLADVEPGRIVTYAELSALVVADVRGSARHSLTSARRIVQRDHRAVFESVRGVGIRRLTDTEIATQCGRETIRAMHRKAGRGLKRIACANTDGLDREAVTRMNADASLIGVMRHVTKAGSLKRIESRVAEKGGKDRLPIGDVLEHLKKD